MGTWRQEGRAIQDQMIKYELIEWFQRAIDNSYRRLRETARHEWESRFAGKEDPSDASVSIRVGPSGIQSPVLPCAGYLPKPLRPCNGQTRPRLAHPLSRMTK
ncbi:MAG: hypothetical protein DME36_12520 [Verrucomicrobia bacterium]|nr:MAG: hypothetical protein DME36_12520 [Verrucomicrobiota bacterium]